ncbi:MAG: hypothetical protein OXU36_12850 [Candidatus Poribacteria bacterium]|nr:hypothetical protein [Candidatus Poribacteria bacterium]
MTKITRDDIQRIGDAETLLHFLEEKLNLSIPEGATLAQIALPLPLPFLGLDNSIAQQIIDCQDFSGLPQHALGERRPFLIRFQREQNYPEILRGVAKSLHQRNTNPADLLFMCANEHFRLFALACFSDSGTEDWAAEVLNIFTWTQGYTRINTGSEHDLSVIFSAEEETSTAPDVPPESKKTSPNDRGKSNLSENLLNKLQETRTRLGNDRDINIHTGINLGYKNAFVIDEDTREKLIDEDPKSADLIELFFDCDGMPEKWRWSERNVIYIPNSRNKRKDEPWPWSHIRDETEVDRIFKEAYPAISAHMNKYKDNLKKESNAKKSNAVEFYWEFPSRSILSVLERPKIIYRTTAISMQAAYDKSHRFLLSSTHFIPTEDLSLLAILNSKLLNWYARRKWKSPNPKINALSFSKQNMVKAPIAEREEEQKAKLADLVQRILDDPDSLEVPDLEQEIDALVYELYKSTPEEIALIEEESDSWKP